MSALSWSNAGFVLFGTPSASDPISEPASLKRRRRRAPEPRRAERADRLKESRRDVGHGRRSLADPRKAAREGSNRQRHFLSNCAPSQDNRCRRWPTVTEPVGQFKTTLRAVHASERQRCNHTSRRAAATAHTCETATRPELALSTGGQRTATKSCSSTPGSPFRNARQPRALPVASMRHASHLRA